MQSIIYGLVNFPWSVCKCINNTMKTFFKTLFKILPYTKRNTAQGMQFC